LHFIFNQTKHFQQWEEVIIALKEVKLLQEAMVLAVLKKPETQKQKELNFS